MGFLLVDFANYQKKLKNILKEVTYVEFSLFIMDMITYNKDDFYLDILYICIHRKK